AIEAAQAVKDKPSLIAVRTVIGYGSPRAGTSKAHGEALGVEGVKQTKKNLGWPEDKFFYVPEDAAKNWLQAVDRGAQEESDWNAQFANYRKAFPEVAAEFERVQAGRLKDGWQQALPQFPADSKPIATRSAGNTVMNAIAKQVPELLGGAADLSTSTKTVIKDSPNFHLDPTGQNIYFGVREFGMCAIVNGMAAHGGIIPYGSTFFVFSDYAKPAIRLAALMQIHSLFIFTHDSIGLGEDGPTHQPVEQLTMLRAIPHMTDFRPADGNETSAAWGLALERKGPAFMALSRQDLPLLDPVRQRVFEGVRHGAYIVEQGGDSPDLLIVGTGAELWPAVRAAEQLKKDGISTRVVSMPSVRIFEEQPDSYKDSIFPDHLPKLAIEAGATLGWWKYVGRDGDVIGLDRFGASAPGATALEKLGFGTDNVVARAKALVERARKTEPAMAGK
ncbi:MAG: transketolase C-terminal domain-containing protein, partial [Acidobacteriaceae bacterium]